MDILDFSLMQLYVFREEYIELPSVQIHICIHGTGLALHGASP